MQGMDDEIWLPAPDLEGIYSISNYGRLRRELKKSNTRAGYILKPFKRKSRYCAYTVWIDGHQHAPLVHRLVAKAFIPNPAKKPCVNHKDGNPANNHAGNLEWVTHKENARHAIEVLGWQPRHANHAKGERHYKAKLTRQQV